MYDLIVAYQDAPWCGDHRGIGKDGKMPWVKINEDMKRFRDITMGCRVVMGRKTFESIGKPLDGRLNVVISRQKLNLTDKYDNVVVYDNLREAVLDGSEGPQRTVVIGGEKIYSECLTEPELYRNLQTVYITRLEFYIAQKCDTFFPSGFFDNPDIKGWKITQIETISAIPEVQNQPHKIEFTTYKHINEDEQNYLNLCKDIMNNGDLVNTRPGIKAKSVFSRQLRFNVRDGVFPALTTKKVFLRGSIEEMLFFVSGKTDTGILKQKGVHIWNGNTTREFLDKRGLHHYPEGDIGVSYSFQFRHAGAEDQYTGCHSDYTGKGVDQIAQVIEELKSDEPNRRIMINLWAVPHMDKMSLPPCLFCYVFYKNEEYVSLQAIMRSADVFLGVPFNITGACLMLNMICHLAGRRPKELVLDMVDAHIYENHFEQIQEQMTRETYPFPRLRIKRSKEEIGTIDGFVYDDFEIINYCSHETLKGKMAV